jgi:spermidine synthase
MTTHVLLGMPTLQSLDTVEIEPLMVQGAQIGFGKAIARAFSDPRSHIRYEDAKTFFAANRRKYDVIVSEPSNPWVSGVATLFSTEFYRQITQFLEPDGMLVQWIQIYETDLEIVLSVMRALDSQFSDFAIYSADNTNILLVAVRSGTVPEPDPRVFASPAVRADLAAVGIITLQDVRSRFLGNRKLLAPLLAASGVPANSDYFPFVDLRAGRARIMRSDARELPALQVLPVPFFELVTGEVDQRTETLVSPRPTSSRDALTGRAVTVKSALLSGDYQDLAAGDAALVMVLHSTREACAVPAVQRAWTQSAYFIAAETSAYLSAHELAPLWDTIAKTQCARLASREDLQFVEFLRAVSQRDVVQTARMGNALFANNYPFAGAEPLQFTMLATAASEIGQDRPNAALETLAAHRAGMQLSRSADLATRILSAIGTERLRVSAAAAATARAGGGSDP